MRPSHCAIAIVLLLTACQTPTAAAPAPASATPPQVWVQSSPVAVATAPGPPAPAVAAASPSAPAGVRVPILMYHYIRVNPNPKDSLGFSLSVTPTDFRGQMDWLRASGRTPVSLEELDLALRQGRRLPPHPVVLTFDDGYADLFTQALPVLQSHGFTAVAYIVTGFLDRPGYLSRAQVRALPDLGVTIGSHTVSHPDLTSLGPAELARQLTASRAELEALTGRAVLDFCYPSGRYNDTVIRAVAGAGYRDATTTAPGLDHGAADRLAWTRIRVSGGESLAQFAAAMNAA